MPPLIKGDPPAYRHPPYQGGQGGSAPPLSRGAGGIGTPLIKGGRGDRHPPYTPLIKGDPPAYRHPPYQGGQGGSEAKSIFDLIITTYLSPNFYRYRSRHVGN
ncbi:MAG: hypothetical protein EWV65_23280 [Microcystis flos-aquae Ma_QC_C_20070823_S18D]|nr:MAG: hypothetical protein EWV65_23280 [Microcystis flos-aquae Ma_QC_C_20070823_S18D]